jgi:hypothetical protein
VETENHYRTASKMLKETKFSWSSYENKQTRPTRVIVKRIHESFTPNRIMQDLHQMRYKITDAVNILRWKNQRTIDSIYVDV